MENKKLWGVTLCILMLTMLCGESIAQVSKQNYALAFKTVATTLQRCGVELCYRRIKAVCMTLNHDNVLFRRLAFAVFCCIKKQRWTTYEPCEGFDYNMVEGDVGHWEKKISAVELEDFAKSQVSLMSFCLHYIRSNHGNIQLGIMKKLAEAAIKADISYSISIPAKLEEKQLQVNTIVQKIKSQTVVADGKVRQCQLNQRKAWKTLELTDPNEHYHSTGPFESTFTLFFRYPITLIADSFTLIIIYRLLSLHEFLFTIINVINVTPLNQAVLEGSTHPIQHY